jgi:WD40 repeat protein
MKRWEPGRSGRNRSALLLLVPLCGIVGGSVFALQSGKPSEPLTRERAAIRLDATALPATSDGSPVTSFAFGQNHEVIIGTASGRIEFRDTGAVARPEDSHAVAGEPVVAVALSSDGSTFAAATERAVYVARRDSPMSTSAIQPFAADDLNSVKSVALDADGHRVAVGALGVYVLDVETGSQIALLEHSDPSDTEIGSYSGVAFSSDGAAVTAANQMEVNTWTMRPPAGLVSVDCGGCNADPSFSRNGRWATYGTRDGDVFLRNLVTGRTTWSVTAVAGRDLHRAGTAVRDDGVVFSGVSTTGEIRAWRPPALRAAGQVMLGGPEIETVRVSPDGRMLLVSQDTDQFIQAAHRYAIDVWAIRIR